MKNINQILEKYWNAETNLQEEAELRAYFASDDVNDEHIAFTGLFHHITQERSNHVDIDIENLFNGLENMDQLLDKYWNAETSLEEEQVIKAYFSSNDIAAKHKEFVSLFSYYEAQRSQTIDLDLNQLFKGSHSIDKLLEKYWNTETNLEEEQLLKDYFNGDDVADEHKEFVSLFSYYNEQGNQTMDLDLNKLLEEPPSINQLLGKYWNTETTIEEEQTLKIYFSGKDIADEHRSFIPLFKFYESAGNASSNLDLETVLTNSNNNTGHRVTDTQSAPQQTEAIVFNLRKLATAVAAIFVLGFAAVTVMNQGNQEETQYKGKYVQLDEEAEAQEAYEITREALAFLSKNMKKGSNTVVNSVAKAEKVSIFK